MARRPQRSTGRALIGGGIGLIVFAVMAWLKLPELEPSTTTSRTIGGWLVAMLGVPVGIGGIVVGIVRIRRGER